MAITTLMTLLFTKTVLEQKTKHAVVSGAKRGNNEMVMLTLDGNKSRMVEMKIE